MEFGIKMLTIKSGKRETTEELPKQESVRMLGENENYKYLELLETDTIKQTGIKEKKATN